MSPVVYAMFHHSPGRNSALQWSHTIVLLYFGFSFFLIPGVAIDIVSPSYVVISGVVPNFADTLEGYRKQVVVPLLVIWKCTTTANPLASFRTDIP